jgi:hypothetical protein
MATAIKIWEVADQTLKPTLNDAFSATHLEAELEGWIVNSPDLIGEEILIIDRQREIPGVGRIDLLGIEGDGTLLIVELKRDLTSREAVAQALDYASWLDSELPQTIVAFADEYLGKCVGKTLNEVFSDKFHVDVPEISCQKHRILLVAARLDGSAERIINYLGERYGININASFFNYSKLSDGKEVLARSMLVADEVRGPGNPPKRPSEQALLAQAIERKSSALVEICRKVAESWEEERNWKYDGCLLYWVRLSSGANRSVFGINTGARYSTPVGQLDVYVVVRNLAEFTGIAEDVIRETLKTKHPVRDMWANECWLRLKSPEDASAIVEQLRSWEPPAVKKAQA